MFGDLVVAGTTLSVGGAGITISGTPISIATSAGSTFIIEGTRTVPLTNPRVTAPPPALLIAGEMVAPNERGEYIVDGKTLSYNGQPVVIDGTSVSLGRNGNGNNMGGGDILVVGSSTSTLSPLAGMNSMVQSGRVRNGTFSSTARMTGTGSSRLVSEPTGGAGSGEEGFLPADAGSSSAVRTRGSGAWEFWWCGVVVGLGVLWMG